MTSAVEPLIITNQYGSLKVSQNDIRWTLSIAVPGAYPTNMPIEDDHAGVTLYAVLSEHQRQLDIAYRLSVVTPSTYAPDERQPPGLRSAAMEAERRTKSNDRLADVAAGAVQKGMVTQLNLSTMTARAEKAEALAQERGVKIIEMTENAGAYLCRAEKAEKELAEARTMLDAKDRAIRALIPYREFFEVIKTITKSA